MNTTLLICNQTTCTRMSTCNASNQTRCIGASLRCRERTCKQPINMQMLVFAAYAQSGPTRTSKPNWDKYANGQKNVQVTKHAASCASMYSLRPKILVKEMDVSRHILVLHTSIFINFFDKYFRTEGVLC